MNLNQRIEILIDLGKEFTEICNNENRNSFPGFKKIFYNNPWFTEEFVRIAMNEWSIQLEESNLKSWLNNYKIPENFSEDFTLGLIMAGNIPLVGLHDFICGFITGAKIKIKLSSKDNILMKWLIDSLIAKYPELESRISVTDERLSKFDAIIATGSNNSNRYFEYYFSNYHNILRKNRNSVAIITGNESNEDLEKLADDIFLYFGLGCRNVSKIYVPKNYNFENLNNAFQKYGHLINHNKYANNFNYQYALIALNRVLHFNFGNLILVENTNWGSPISILNYEYYSDIDYIKKQISASSEQIQCVVCLDKTSKGYLSFGETQKPKITDYADNIDTINFILKNL
jgi:hypothetical protein